MQCGLHTPDQEVLEVADGSITGSNFVLLLSYESSSSFYKRTCSQSVLRSYMSYLMCCSSLLIKLGKLYCSQNTEVFLFFFSSMVKCNALWYIFPTSQVLSHKN